MQKIFLNSPILSSCLFNTSFSVSYYLRSYLEVFLSVSDRCSIWISEIVLFPIMLRKLLFLCRLSHYKTLFPVSIFQIPLLLNYIYSYCLMLSSLFPVCLFSKSIKKFPLLPFKKEKYLYWIWSDIDDSTVH